MIRSKKTLRIIAIFLLLDILQFVFQPTIALALTQGPNQSEYTSYEPFGATDMVNLSTGDFIYNLPLVSIPGPEGGFSMPLAYHAGIGLEQEATWVGLGWSLNPGAISRSMIQYPDDAYGEFNSNRDIMEIHSTSPGGYAFGNNYILYQRNFDSQKGFGGAVNLLGIGLTIGWDKNGLNSISYGGVTANESGVKVDPFGLATTIMGVAMGGGGLTALEQGVSLASNIGFAIASAPNFSTKSEYLGWTIEQSGNFFRYDVKYYLDSYRYEEMYGPLYFGKMFNSTCPNTGPTYGSSNVAPRYGNSTGNIRQVKYFNMGNVGTLAGVSSDMHLNTEGEYPLVVQPSSIAYDHFSVNSEVVSGTIKPYRLETGSLAIPRKFSNSHSKFNTIPFIDYKAQFKYDGYSNHYDYHKGLVNDHIGVNHAIVFESGNPGKNVLALDCIDESIKHDIVNGVISNTAKRVESPRYGLHDNKLLGSRNIEWFTNSEIIGGSPITEGKFIDFLSSADNARTNFRNSCNVPNGIGGYSITSEDGRTYHFALPVYNKKQYAYAYEGADNSMMKLFSPYATTWLLTAITGPDFVDRGEIGIIDEADWGYWVKLEYGKFSSEYIWRTPYGYDEYSPDDLKSKNFSQGYKETYYLDKVTTRSHTALFVKDVRKDGRSYYSNTRVLDLGISEIAPSSSLYLKEIIVLNNADYKKLVTTNGIAQGVAGLTNASGASLTGLYRSTDNPNSVLDIADITSNGNVYRNFVDAKTQNKIVFNYDYSLCVNTTNSFDAATPPAFSDPHLGKLTLLSISTYTANNEKLFPDYSFDYGTNNPNYAGLAWDGWGMYKSDGSIRIGHRTKSNNATDGSAWSLKKITTPSGSTIEVDYERDSYASVSGHPIKVKVPLKHNTSHLDWRVYPDFSEIDNSLGNILHNGETIELRAILEQECEEKDCLEPASKWAWISRNHTFNTTQVVSGLDASSFVLSNPPSNLPWGDYCCVPLACSRKNCKVELIYGYFFAEMPELKGGDIRVSQLKISDGINTYKTRYIYSVDGTPTGATSGVIGKEPPFISGYNYPFNNHYDYPMTPVIYGKVTVLEGKLSTDNDYLQKTEYQFETPNASMINSTLHGSGQFDNVIPVPGDLNYNTVVFKKYNFKVDVNTSRIGKINQIRKYDKMNTVLSTTNFGYNENNHGTYQGVHSEGSIMSETVLRQADMACYQKFIRTTKHYYPTVLTSVTTKTMNSTNKVTNTNFDFLTGSVIEKDYTNSLGVKYKSVTVPAYERYPEMGSKALDPKNKNMMSQVTGEYLYKIVPNSWTYETTSLTNLGTSGGLTTYKMDFSTFALYPTFRVGSTIAIVAMRNGTSSHFWVTISEISLDRKSFKFKYDSSRPLTNPSSYPHVDLAPVSVGIQAWSNVWNERVFDEPRLRYKNVEITDNSSTGMDERVWRKKASYAWKSPILNTDGTYKHYVDYNWDSLATQHTNWQKAGEVVNYDVYSKPIESKDINDNFSAMKMGYDNKYSVIAAANANYNEIAYSGAEDLNTVGQTGYFGGEVFKNGGVPDNTVAHTGKYSTRLDYQKYGFTYVAQIGPEGVSVNKPYRASVWIYDNGNKTANLYYKLSDPSGAGVTTANEGYVNLQSANTVVTCGKWKLLTLDFKLTEPTVGAYTGYHLGFACTNWEQNLPAYFDDFRFHPLSTSMSCNVYDPQSGLVTHVLDGDGFYTRYEYDARNRIKAVYKETIKGEIKTTEYNYNSAVPY